MKIIRDHIEQVKGRPHHVRKQVTFVYAGALTALIAVVWLGTSLTTGAFALRNTSFADTGGEAPVTVSGSGAPQGLAGAAAAPQARDSSARIEIVDTASTTSQRPEPTTIPF